ncbi:MULTISPECIES: hypothetical protein [Aerococcus]|uniref:Uncharacterized protein n=1 Tax=Aerococcus sanguinicola TaxID=119206 RepID=A0A5N1GJ32_9LACT|nr:MULTISPECIES: hypothetical protein [Aerococcus]KAA9300199.1 hypothetical protein F6I03_08555 [Aerococcus sanguinicola]MDK6369544.1 hypothetical protein [Aerococcus sp. UMB9870]MDK6680032.1 hypothetical protein [Aerococcus sp. UMB8608]MDK6686087.1 hypothetical protein [Aerococcus sp. UMB8623]MDK6939867.1 hypothetical protein [Aerococcus sp. UMB8487]
MKRTHDFDHSWLRPALIQTSFPYVLSLLTFIIIFFRGAEAALANLWLFNLLALVMTAFVLWTDYQIMIHMNHIKVRSAGLLYLVISGLFVLSFQVFYDMMLTLTISVGHFIFFDAMYNLSFCALFIVAFKISGLYLIDLFAQIRDRY